MRLLFFSTALCVSLSVCGQQAEVVSDSVPAQRADSVLIRAEGGKVVAIESYAARFDPRKALLYSAIFPGAGQIYNKKYWKAPLVYAGFATGIVLVTSYQNIHNDYKTELFDLLEDGGGLSLSGFTETQLRTLIRKTKRERDFWTIMTGFWYILQMVDAHVDAHLKEFELNPQLQIGLEPAFNNDQLTGRTQGFSLTLRF